MLCIAAHGAGTHTVAARGAPGCSLCPYGCSLRPSGCSLRPYGCSLHPYGCSLHPYGCRHDKLFMPETLRGELWERREAAEAQGDPDADSRLPPLQAHPNPNPHPHPHPHPNPNPNPSASPSPSPNPNPSPSPSPSPNPKQVLGEVSQEEYHGIVECAAYLGMHP